MRNLKRSALIALIVAPVAIGVPALAFADPVDQVGESIIEQDIDQEQDNETDQENSNTGGGLLEEPGATAGGDVEQRNDNATDQDQRAEERAEGGNVSQDQDTRSESSTLLPVPALPAVPAVPVVPLS